jgi:hypothetical protein
MYSYQNLLNDGIKNTIAPGNNIKPQANSVPQNKHSLFMATSS